MRVCASQACSTDPGAAGGSTTCEVIGLSSRFPVPTAPGSHAWAGSAGAPRGSSLFWRTQLMGSNIPAAVPFERWDVDASYAPAGGTGKACAFLSPAVLSHMCLARICFLHAFKAYLSSMSSLQARACQYDVGLSKQSTPTTHLPGCGVVCGVTLGVAGTCDTEPGWKD